jgi:anti-sigma factor RsiW
MDVTRRVISDLWPIYASGEASGDTRAVVEAFLAQDPTFARTLREGAGAEGGLRRPELVRLPPDHELLSIRQTQRRVWGYGSLVGCAMLFSFLAFARLAIDASFGVSTQGVLWQAALAVVFWIAFAAKMLWNRAHVVILAPKTTLGA